MKFKLLQYPELKRQTEEMTIRQLLKTVICPQHHAEDPAPEKGYLSLFLHETTKENVRRFIDVCHEDGKPDAIICSDTECGAGEMIEGCVRFSSMAALGRIGDDALAYQVGLATAKDCLNAGYRWSLSPCVDILLNHESPMVSTRAAGEDADTVIRIAGAYMRGMQDGGLVATIKHFPGDGKTQYDQHITTAVNPLSKEDWMASYGKVYRTLIEQGAMSVMPGHIALPCFDVPDEEIGLCPPATLSYNLMTKLLKEELGFEGIVCSDAVTMSGFSGFLNYYKACATFLKNGGDILLFARTDETFYTRMENLTETGFLPLDVLRNRAYRVLCFAKQIHEEFRPKTVFSGDIQELSDLVVEKSAAAVRDRVKLLPVKDGKNKKILFTDLSNVYDGSADSECFFEFLADRAYQVERIRDAGSEKMAELAESGAYDLILCTVDNGFSFGTNVLRLHGLTARNMMNGWTRLGTPVVFICFRHPFFHEQFAVSADTVINTYGVANATFSVVERLIFG